MNDIREEIHAAIAACMNHWRYEDVNDELDESALQDKVMAIIEREKQAAYTEGQNSLNVPLPGNVVDDIMMASGYRQGFREGAEAVIANIKESVKWSEYEDNGTVAGAYREAVDQALADTLAGKSHNNEQ